MLSVQIRVAKKSVTIPGVARGQELPATGARRRRALARRHGAQIGVLGVLQIGVLGVLQIGVLGVLRAVPSGGSPTSSPTQRRAQLPRACAWRGLGTREPSFFPLSPPKRSPQIHRGSR